MSVKRITEAVCTPVYMKDTSCTGVNVTKDMSWQRIERLALVRVSYHII